MRFSAEQAIQASENGDPILVTVYVAHKIIATHDVGNGHKFFAEIEVIDGKVNVGEVFVWLGY